MGAERERAVAFAERLADIHGDDLISVLLYGSAARGEYREKSSDLNLLLLLASADAAALRRGGAAAREWVEAGNPPPLIMSEREWQTSADVFPIEYSDMKDAHVVLRGADPFAELEIQWEDLRHQCEHELKGKQIQIRERYLMSAEHPDEIGELLVRSLSTILTMLRTLLRLGRDPVPVAADEVIQAAAKRVGFDPEPMRQILRAKAADEMLSVPAADPLPVEYLEAIARAVDWLDSLSHPAPAAAPNPPVQS